MLRPMTERFAGFRLEKVGDVPLLWRPDERFKTFRVALYAQRPLDERTAARGLLPGLLLHGTELDPDRATLARRMERLYGAAVSPSTGRHSESQVLRFSLDAVAGAFLPGRPDQLGDGMAFLADIALRPRLQGDGFPRAAFDRERRQAAAAARALFDDKAAWARQQAMVHGCRDEPIAIPEHGGVQAIEALEPRDPEAARQDFLRHGRLWAVAMGTLPEDFPRRFEELVGGLPPRREEPLPPPVRIDPREPTSTVERARMQQAKQVMLFRFPAPQDAAGYAAANVTANLLGGGPHARLFREVREKRSLAYYAAASADLLKGLLIVQVGLDGGSAGQVRDETLRQLRALAGGDFADAELATAIATIVGPFAAVEDSISWRMQYTSEQWLLELDQTPEQKIAVYRAVGREAVVDVARRTWLDHDYLLAPEEPL